MSLPLRGAWIEMRQLTTGDDWCASLPLRGAWIEMSISSRKQSKWRPSLPLRGAWIEIGVEFCNEIYAASRSPCGERGLKLSGIENTTQRDASLPLRGAWIEISSSRSDV